MKIALFGLVAILLLAVGGLFLLGRFSQGGAAPGLVEGRLAPCPSAPNCVSSGPDTPEDHRVAPLSIDAWADLPDVIADMGGTVTTRTDAYLAASFTSKTFKFVDDVEFRRTEDAIHVRSASRVGYSDRGANAARVTEIRDRLAP